jgi:hypothetical protein
MSGVIGISTAEQGRYSLFYASLTGLQRPAQAGVIYARGSVISENRNLISQFALDEKADWVLYLDDDHVMRSDTLTRLIEADKDVISAHYTRRQPPFSPCLLEAELPDGTFTWKGLASSDRGVIEVAGAGAGCLLVKTDVLRAIGAPYWTLGQIDPSSWGDDLHFCSRVRKAGYRIYCDLDAHIGHMMTGVLWPTFDETHGWVANFAQDEARSGVIARWPMPLNGDSFK